LRFVVGKIVTIATDHHYVLLLSCQSRKGIVAAVTVALARLDCDIMENAQYVDQAADRFFMRVRVIAPHSVARAELEAALAPIVAEWGLEWRLHDMTVKLRAMILVSKGGHCLNDLLYRTAADLLPMTITSVVSNHTTWQRRVEHEGLPFHHLPITPETKAVQEVALSALIAAQQVDLVILARYMQVFSEGLCEQLGGRVINIHHSFLPGFKGANPYHRAHATGVKMVGATAHYVTADLDEGPIIAQDVSVVDHAHTINDLIRQGQDTESRVLARAVGAHLEHRVMLNGARTVVFR
jgi:formyltetrahydrofolate deformylase